MTDPVKASAAWFAALKGRVRPCVVYRQPASDGVDAEVVLILGHTLPVVYPIISGSSGALPWWRESFAAPDGAQEGERYWVATADAVRSLEGVGKTPAEAIEAFNLAMVTS